MAELGRSMKRNNPIGQLRCLVGQCKPTGIVFARAAATGTVEPLTDIDSRMFVGLPPNGDAD